MATDTSNYERHKDEGNNYFKAKNYNKAIESYTKAIEANSIEAVTYCNRAACYINLGKYFDVLNDCDTAIELNPNLTKAYYRRAKALSGLSRFNSALEDYKKVISLEPDNKSIMLEKNDIEKKLAANDRLDLRLVRKPDKYCSTKPLLTFKLNNQFIGSKLYRPQ